jgi:hypothetical protein
MEPNARGTNDEPQSISAMPQAHAACPEAKSPPEPSARKQSPGYGACLRRDGAMQFVSRITEKGPHAMDDKQFEELSKSLASGQSRRRVLKGIAGGALTGVAGLFAHRAAPAAAGGTTTTTTTKAPTTSPPTTKAPFCGHSTGPNGGCKGACTSAGFTGNQCNEICGNGQFTGFCPVGQGGGNPCCNTGFCDPANYSEGTDGNPVYTGPTSGCAT